MDLGGIQTVADKLFAAINIKLVKAGLTIHMLTSKIALTTSGTEIGTVSKMKTAIIPSTFGDLIISTLGDAICGLEFGNDYTENSAIYKRIVAWAKDTLDPQLVANILSIIEHGIHQDYQIHLVGTPFQLDVWNALITIPEGETRTYKEIAKQVGKPKSVRAVANAIGANPIAVLVPCHRVVRSDGSLGGYRYGIEIKMKLLEREGVLV